LGCKYRGRRGIKQIIIGRKIGKGWGRDGKGEKGVLLARSREEEVGWMVCWGKVEVCRNGGTDYIWEDEDCAHAEWVFAFGECGGVYEDGRIREQNGGKSFVTN